MQSSFCPTCPPCPCLSLLGLQVELGGFLGTGMALPCPPSLVCRHEFTDEITGITRVTALLLSKQSDCTHPCVCCPFLTASLPRAGLHWTSPGAAKLCFLMEQSPDYFGSNDTENSFSKSFVALLGSKGLFYYWQLKIYFLCRRFPWSYFPVLPFLVRCRSCVRRSPQLFGRFWKGCESWTWGTPLHPRLVLSIPWQTATSFWVQAHSFRKKIIQEALLEDL